MFQFLIAVNIVSLLLMAFEAVHVFTHLSTRMHSYLLLYLVAAIINNIGYVYEMTAQTSEAAYLATRFLYFGKVFIPVGLILFVLRFNHIDFSKKVGIGLFVMHLLFWIIITTNSFHHLYYSSITFTTEGLFPHNIYGHGPLYFVYQGIQALYCFGTVAITAFNYRKMRTQAERMQIVFLIIAPLMSMLGLLIFLTGVTKGFDTSNIGICLCSVFMMLILFKYRLMETTDMVKNMLVDSLDDGIITVNSRNKVVYINGIAEKIFAGLTLDRKNETLINDLDNKAKKGDITVLNDRYYVIKCTELMQGEIYRGKMYVLDDMTDTINYTKKIEAEKKRADEANAAKSDFLSNMSHEIRTPMNAIVGMTDILLRDDMNEQERSYLQNIKSSGSALLDIINDILDFSKIESGKMTIIPDEYQPLLLLNDLKMIFITRIGDKPLRLEYDIDENLPAVLMGDKIRIRQIIINLMNNAIKFTDVGYVGLNVTVEPLGEDIVLCIAVKDSGAGIKPEDIDKLFDSFTQVDTKKNYGKEGTGLGLTITKQLVELMGGSIDVKSEYGKGSEFLVRIPQRVIDATKATKAKYKKKADVDMNFTAPDAKVLLVEDNELNVKVAKGLLAPFEFEMDVAGNGMVALKKVSEKEYDIIFMDHMMPVMDGIEATKRIREFEGAYYKNVPIIALTANAIQSAREEFTAAGMNDFVGKPISMKDISATLRKWLPANKIIEKDESLENADYILGSDIAKEMEIKFDESKESDLDISVKGEEKMVAELDREVGITYCGTEDLYLEVLEDFYKLIDSKSAKIEELLATDDIRNYTIEVHALKSTARMIGATKLSEMAYEMEMAGNANDRALIDEKTPALMSLYRAYKELLEAEFGGPKGEKEEVPVSEIKAEIIRMNLAVRDFDMDAMDASMAKLNKYKMPNAEADKLISELDTLVRDVSFEDIKVKVQDIMKTL